MNEDLIERYRYFLKDSIRKEIDFSQTDQSRGCDIPPIEKPYPADASFFSKGWVSNDSEG